VSFISLRIMSFFFFLFFRHNFCYEVNIHAVAECLITVFTTWCLSNEQLYLHNAQVSTALNVIRRENKVSSLSCLADASPWLRLPRVVVPEFPPSKHYSRVGMPNRKLFYRLRKTRNGPARIQRNAIHRCRNYS